MNEPTSTTLYSKEKTEKGHRFVPVAEYCHTDYYREGSYLLTVRPGRRTIIAMVFPNRVAEVEAALEHVSDGMLDAMTKAAVEPTNKPKRMTTKQVKAFREYCKAFKIETIWHSSAQAVIDAGLAELRNALGG